MDYVILRHKTAKGRNRLQEAKLDSMKWYGGWSGKWRVVDRRNGIQADPRKGPFLLVTPEHEPDNSKYSRWVHAELDKDFDVVVC